MDAVLKAQLKGERQLIEVAIAEDIVAFRRLFSEFRGRVICRCEHFCEGKQARSDKFQAHLYWKTYLFALDIFDDLETVQRVFPC